MPAEEQDRAYGKHNYVQIDSKIPNRLSFFYVDLPEHLADQAFSDHKLPTMFRNHEFHREGTPYVIVECTVKKKYRRAFLEAMADLERAMLAAGHADYSAFCERSLGVFYEEAAQ